MLQFRQFVLLSTLALAAPGYAGKLAIVIDDFGYRPHQENQVLTMPSAISVAVLPNAPHAREMATKAHNSGHEVLIHLPMAPLSKQPLEKDTLRPDMSSDEIERIIREAVDKVPYAVGLNNHMGSAMTSSLFGMQKVMQALGRYNLYFLDSMTIGNSQAMRAANGTSVKVIKRRVFLDDTQNEADIRVQFNRAIQRPCGYCSRWSITCRQISRWCVRAVCSTNRRLILQGLTAVNQHKSSQPHRVIHSAALSSASRRNRWSRSTPAASSTY